MHVHHRAGRPVAARLGEPPVQRTGGRGRATRIKFHAARHTAASLALEAGIDIRIVSEQVGHSSTSFTRDRYQHVRRQVARDAAEMVVALLPDEDSGTDAGTES